MPAKRTSTRTPQGGAKKTTGKKAAAKKTAAKKAVRAAPAAASAPSVPAILIPSQRRERALRKMGAQLRRTLEDLALSGSHRGLARRSMDYAEGSVAAAGGGGGFEPVLPISATLPAIPLEPNESWAHYRERAANVMGPVLERLRANAGLTCLPFYSGNAIGSKALEGQVEEALQDDAILQMDMDAPMQATAMDDTVQDVDLPLARFRHPDLDGRGVVVAVLDSGADTQHPWLRLHDSFSVQGQDIHIPGAHGTHVAGIIGSQDSVYPGIAPGVTLLNIRVLDAWGVGIKNDLGRGIDRALDGGAHLINLSIAFNHRPTWSQRGHGHSCPDGECVMCRAVNNALNLSDGALAVIVAAGNEHEYCEFLRSIGQAGAFDTELGCPGQARQALTIGALTKQTFVTAPFSSRGPTAYGLSKPDISAPGVNITSAAVVPRDSAGQVLGGLTRADLSRKDSGTSMAAPVVTGVAALLTQRLLPQGLGMEAMRTMLRRELLSSAFFPLTAPAHEVGVGRISLARL